jgi:hypothetical protein
MAKQVQYQVCGGDIKTVDDVATVAELGTKLGLAAGYAATIKGEPAEPGDRLRDYDFVGFAKATAGGI